MILVTLGTQKFQMNRLIKKMDELALSVKEEIFIQIGHSTYHPVNCAYQEFVDAERFQEMINECTLLITHSGVGTIMRAIDAKKPIIVVPRLAEFHEHVDDHQVQIAKAFDVKKCVLYCDKLERLEQLIERAKCFRFEPYEKPKHNVEDIILSYIEQEYGGMCNE